MLQKHIRDSVSGPGGQHGNDGDRRLLPVLKARDADEAGFAADPFYHRHEGAGDLICVRAT